MAAKVPSEEPRLSRRYVGGNKYRWFIIGARSHQVIDDTDFDGTDEASAKKYYESVRTAWENRNVT